VNLLNSDLIIVFYFEKAKNGYENFLRKRKIQQEIQAGSL
jgi:hypothetical protein